MTIESLYQQRLRRYAIALRNEQPDAVPIRPFVAEFTAKYAGYTCQEVTHDYHKAFDALIKCCQDFDWDAVVPNMIYVWTGLTEALGLRYYRVPGIDLDPNTGFQYIEPPPQKAWMLPHEYDQLIADPTGYLLEVWLPRVSRTISKPGSLATTRAYITFLHGANAMWKYFHDLGNQVVQLREKTGTVSAISGILKAPFDILADKLRGYIGLTIDVARQPEKVLAACEALMPHLTYVAAATADPSGTVPIGFWMHRGCVPFVRPETFDRIYWPTLKPIIEELWRLGHQVLFYAEGNWDAHLDRFLELPERSIIYHVDKGDIFLAKRKLGEKFAISGGIPNILLSHGSPNEIRGYVKRIIQEVGQNGGYILDASAIVQDDAQPQNVKAMTETAREVGVYSRGHTPTQIAPPLGHEPHKINLLHHKWPGAPTTKPPGVCVAWQDYKTERGPFSGEEELVKQIWEQIDSMGYMFIWQILLSF